MTKVSTKTGPARHLEFDHLSDAIGEAELLHAGGYRKTGNWSLATMLNHCDYWIASAFETPEKPPALMRPAFWVVSRLIGRRLLDRIRTNKKMGGGLPTSPASIIESPPADRGNPQDQAAIDGLKATIERFKNHTGPIHRSPIFGDMNKREAAELHRVHLAHHLGYLTPLD